MKLDSNTILQVVERLVGPIQPVGETHTDDVRYENLEVMCQLANKLVQEIDRVAYDHRNAHEYSRKRASGYAKNFIDNTLGIK